MTDASIRLATARPRFDAERAELAVAELLLALGEDPFDERLRATPGRVAATLHDLLTPPDLPAPTLLVGEGYRELVLVRDIPFQSVCEHHLLPFRGIARVGYLPGERVVGLSTLVRVVEHFARRLQMQERMTDDIADWLETELAPRGVGVVLDAEQLCMSMRGVGTPATRTTTTAFRGDLRRPGPDRDRFGTH